MDMASEFSIEETVMRIGVMGSGTVGRTIGSALVAKGHQVWMGTRSPCDVAAPAVGWARNNGPQAISATFAEAAQSGEVLFNCLRGSAAPDVLGAIEAQHIAGKVLIDVGNDLD